MAKSRADELWDTLSGGGTAKSTTTGGSGADDLWYQMTGQKSVTAPKMTVTAPETASTTDNGYENYIRNLKFAHTDYVNSQNALKSAQERAEAVRSEKPAWDYSLSWSGLFNGEGMKNVGDEWRANTKAANEELARAQEAYNTAQKNYYTSDYINSGYSWDLYSRVTNRAYNAAGNALRQGKVNGVTGDELAKLQSDYDEAYNKYNWVNGVQAFEDYSRGGKDAAQHYIDSYNTTHAAEIAELEKQRQELLNQYQWGNASTVKAANDLLTTKIENIDSQISAIKAGTEPWQYYIDFDDAMSKAAAEQREMMVPADRATADKISQLEKERTDLTNSLRAPWNRNGSGADAVYSRLEEIEKEINDLRSGTELVFPGDIRNAEFESRYGSYEAAQAAYDELTEHYRAYGKARTGDNSSFINRRWGESDEDYNARVTEHEANSNVAREAAWFMDNYGIDMTEGREGTYGEYIDDLYRYMMGKKFAEITGAADFDEKSAEARNSSFNTTAARVNHPEDFDMLAGPNSLDYHDLYYYIDDDQRSSYNYILNTEGSKAAEEYISFIKPTLGQRRAADLEKEWQNYAAEHEFVSTLIRTPVNLMSGVGTIDAVIQSVVRGQSGEYNPTDYNSMAYDFTRIANTITEAVSKEIVDATGVITIDAERHPYLAEMLNGKSLADLYQLGTSILDSTAIMGIPGGTALLGGAAATSTLLDAVDRGLSDEDALSMALFAGTAESLFEYVSLDKVKSLSSPNMLVNWLIASGVEGSEEFLTSLANDTYDILANADMSKRSQMAYEYYNDGKNGISLADAYKKADTSLAVDLLWDSVGGMISGGAHTATINLVRSAINMSNSDYRAARQDARSIMDDYRYDTGAVTNNAEARLSELGEDNPSEVAQAVAYLWLQKFYGKAAQAWENMRGNSEFGPASERRGRHYEDVLKRSKHGQQVLDELNNAGSPSGRPVGTNIRGEQMHVRPEGPATAAQNNEQPAGEMSGRPVGSTLRDEQMNTRPEDPAGAYADDLRNYGWSQVGPRMEDGTFSTAEQMANEPAAADGTENTSAAAEDVDVNDESVERKPGETDEEYFARMVGREAERPKASAAAEERTAPAAEPAAEEAEQSKPRWTDKLGTRRAGGAAMGASYSLPDIRRRFDVKGKKGTYSQIHTSSLVINDAGKVVAAVANAKGEVQGETIALGALPAEQQNLFREARAELGDNAAAVAAFNGYAEAAAKYAEAHQGAALSVGNYLKSFAAAYSLGVNGVKTSSDSYKNSAAHEVIGSDMVKQAYDAGNAFAENLVKKADAKVNKAIKRGNVTAEAMSVEVDPDTGYKEIKGAKLYAVSKEELGRMDIETVAMYGAILGKDIRFFKGYEGELTENTDLGEAQGVHDAETGTIYIDINAGMLTANDVGRRALLMTLSHELTHDIQSNAKESYNELKDFVLKNISAGDNAALEEMISRKMDETKLDRDGAIDEIVADACSTMLLDSKIAEQLRNENRSLYEKICNFVAEFFDKLKRNTEELSLKGVVRQEAIDMAAHKDELQRIWDKALYTSVKNQMEGRQTDVDGQPGAHQLSIRSMVEGTGFTYHTDDNGNFDYMLDSKGKRVNHVTPGMIANSPLGNIINLSNQRGFISEDAVQQQYQMFSDVMNLIVRLDDAALVWDMVGTEFFSAMKNNSDTQYGKTIDFSTVCKKTQAIVDAMSETMKRLGRGLTRQEVETVYLETHKAGETVPCPVCYVFSRWMGIGGVLNQIKKYQETYGNMSVDELNAFAARIQESVKQYWRDAGTDKKGNAYYDRYIGANGAFKIGKALSDMKGKLDAREASTMNKIAKSKDAELKIAELQKIIDQGNLKKGDITKLRNRIKTQQKSVLSAEQIADIEKAARAIGEQFTELEAYQFVMKAVLQEAEEVTEDTRYEKRTDFAIVPDDILFDLNKGDEFLKVSPATWGYRTTRGAALGKAMLPYSDARVGESIQGVYYATVNDIKIGADINAFLNGDTTKQQEMLSGAINKMRRQNLIGGMRYQSTSDFRYEYGSDYLMTFLEMQAMGANVQLYTKVIEAVDFLAGMGADCNLSLMPAADGVITVENEDGTTSKKLVFSDVTGINYEAALAKTRQYDNVQMILVGISDEHIRLAIGGDEITFVIPYHGSGNTVHQLNVLMQMLGEDLRDEANTSDYTAVQSDHFRKRRTQLQKDLWDLRMDIIQGNLVDKKGNLTVSPEQRELMSKSPFLSDLFNRFYVDQYKRDANGNVMYDHAGNMMQTDEYHNFLAKAQAEHIFPYEYWDKSLTIDQADENGRRFIEYCKSMGMIPRFSGLDSDGKKTGFGDFTQDKGYWKLLIDRKMYNNDGTYHEQKKINVSAFDIGMLDSKQASLTYGDAMSKINDPLKTPQIVDAAIAKINAADDGVQFQQRDQRYLELTADPDTNRDNEISRPESESIREGTDAGDSRYSTANEQSSSVKNQLREAQANDIEVLDTAFADSAATTSERRAYRDYKSQVEKVDALKERVSAAQAANKAGETADTRVALQQARDDLRREEKILYGMVNNNADLKKVIKAARAIDAARMDAEYVEQWNRDYNELTGVIAGLEAELNAARAEQKQTGKDNAKSIKRLQGQLESKKAEVAKLKQKRTDDVAKTKQRYQDMIKRQREGREATGIRGKIKKLVNDLNQRLTNPKEGHYVPKELTQMTISVLEAINMDTWQAEAKLREIDAAIAKLDSSAKNYSKKLQELLDQRKRYEARDQKFKENAAVLKAQYDALKQGDHSELWDETVSEMLQNMLDAVGNTAIRDMNNKQLGIVHDALKSLHHVIDTSIKVKIGNEERSFWDIARQMTKEARAAKKFNLKNNAAILATRYWNDMLRPQVVFERFGGYAKDSMWSKVFELFNEGQRAVTRLTMEMSEKFAPMVNDAKAMRDFTGRTQTGNVNKDKLVDIGLKDENGNAIMITHEMMVSVYLNLENEQNKRHMLYGGLTVPDLADYYKQRAEGGFGQKSIHAVGVSAEAEALEQIIRTSEDEAEIAAAEAKLLQMEDAATAYEQVLREAISKELTDFDRKWIDAVRYLFDVQSKGYLDKVTEAIYGISKAQVENYFPIITDEVYRMSDFATVMRNMNLENAGFMKERVNSKVPIYLLGVSDMVNRQIDKTAQYCGLMPAQRAFNKIWNKGDRNSNDSLKKAVRDQFGKYGSEYIENLMGDITGSRGNEQGVVDRFFAALRGNLAQTTLTLNLRVAAAQAASYPTAAAVVGWDALRKGLTDTSKVDTNLIAKYTPLWWYRMNGFADVELGDIKKNQSATAQLWKKMRWATGWIQAVDGYTTAKLWKAAQYYVQDTMGIRNDGSDAYYDEVAKVYNDIIEKTQPNYTTMQRPELLRNPSAIQKTFTMFMTQRLQNVSIMADAVNRYNRYAADLKAGAEGITVNDVKEARDGVIRAAVSQVVASAMIVGIKFLVDGIMHNMKKYRDDEDDEITAKSVSAALLDSGIDTVVGNFFFGSTVYSFVKASINKGKWYDVSLNGIDSINDLMDSIVQLANEAAKDEVDKDKLNKKLGTLVDNLATTLGMPIPNAKKLYNAVKYHVEDIASGEFLSFNSDLDRTDSSRINRLIKAWESGEDDVVEAMRTELGDEKKSATKIKAAVKKWYSSGQKDAEWTKRYLTELLGYKPEEAKGIMDYWDLLKEDKSYQDVISQSSYSKYLEKVKSTGMTVETYADILDKADADANGSVSQDELGKYLKKLARAGDVSTAQANAVWDTKWDKTSYSDWLKKNK